MASFWDLNHGRKAVLKLVAQAKQVNDLSVAIQRKAQQKAQKKQGSTLIVSKARGYCSLRLPEANSD